MLSERHGLPALTRARQQLNLNYIPPGELTRVDGAVAEARATASEVLGICKHCSRRRTTKSWCRSKCFGRIAKIEIVPCPADEQEFWRRRSLPLDLDQYKLPGHFLCTANFRAPYWDRATWRKVWEYSAETQSASAEVPALSPMALASSAPLG